MGKLSWFGWLLVAFLAVALAWSLFSLRNERRYRAEAEAAAAEYIGKLEACEAQLRR